MVEYLMPQLTTVFLLPRLCDLLRRSPQVWLFYENNAANVELFDHLGILCTVKKIRHFIESIHYIRAKH